MNESLNNLLIALSQLEVTPDPIPEYRFYYNEFGVIVSCSQFDHPDAGDYLVVTKQQYDNYTQYEVKNGKLVTRPDTNRILSGLIKADSGYATVKGHSALLIEANEQYETIEYYAPRNR